MTLTVLEFSNYHRILITGAIGSGKSAWMEWAAEKFYNKGWLILDWLDARDFEGCFWAIPGYTGVRYPIILVHPEYVSINSPNSYVKPMCDKQGLESILRTAIAEKRIISIGVGLYRGDHYHTLASKWLRFLISPFRESIDANILLLLREAGNIAFSRFRLNRGESKTKGAILDVMRHSRHNQISLLFDAQRLMDVDAMIRQLASRLIVKKQALAAIPEEMQWIPRLMDKRRFQLVDNGFSPREAAKHFPSVSHLYPSEFIAAFPEDRQAKKLNNTLPSFHHKRPEDSFWKMSGCTFTYSEVTVEGEKVRKQQEKLQRMIELRQQGLTLEEIASQVGMTRQGVKYHLDRVKEGSVKPVKETIPTD